MVSSNYRVQSELLLAYGIVRINSEYQFFCVAASNCKLWMDKGAQGIVHRVSKAICYYDFQFFVMLSRLSELDSSARPICIYAIVLVPVILRKLLRST